MTSTRRETPTGLGRRALLRGAVGVGAAAAPTLPGSAPGAAQHYSPPPRLPRCEGKDDGGVNWTPDVGLPVFYGIQQLGPADGAPANLRVHYPTYEGFVAGAPLLKLCQGGWPVVLFLHGQPPIGMPWEGYYQRWGAYLPSMLARCGYVVVVPEHQPALPDQPYSPAVQKALDVIDWVRTDWEHASWVCQEPQKTVVAGHSYGALLAMRVAAYRPSFGAFVSLSGTFSDLGTEPTGLLALLTTPKLFLWARGNLDSNLAFEDIDHLGIWSDARYPKWSVDFDGGHWDYLSSRTGMPTPFGPCSWIPLVSAELATLFIARTVPVPGSSTTVMASLRPPQVDRTWLQQFFAGSHLVGQELIRTDPNCDMRLRWQTSASQYTAGTRQLGYGAPA